MQEQRLVIKRRKRRERLLEAMERAQNQNEEDGAPEDEGNRNSAQKSTEIKKVQKNEKASFLASRNQSPQKANQ